MIMHEPQHNYTKSNCLLAPIIVHIKGYPLPTSIFEIARFYKIPKEMHSIIFLVNRIIFKEMIQHIELSPTLSSFHNPHEIHYMLTQLLQATLHYSLT